MKKLITLGIAGMMFLWSSCAFADWSVTVTWTRSVGPNLASESVLLDEVQKCTVMPADPTSCQFNVATLSGQAVKVRSFNAQGAFADTHPVVLSAVPAPATGVLINVTYIQQ